VHNKLQYLLNIVIYYALYDLIVNEDSSAFSRRVFCF